MKSLQLESGGAHSSSLRVQKACTRQKGGGGILMPPPSRSTVVVTFEQFFKSDAANGVPMVYLMVVCMLVKE
jgi:hypothetical protein